MATLYQLEVEAQPSIYKPKDRRMSIYFAEPENGINKETGILLLLAGYGGTATSHVFAKMRKLFADEYNVVAIQCDYFGFEYMQNELPVEIDDEMLMQSLSDAELELLNRDYDKYAHILQGKIFKQNIDLQETPEYFNDMGLMQAIDNLRAVKVVLDIIKDNKYDINENRIYAYGFLHGSYLEYLCNAFCPGLFTGMIDNSAYLEPFFWKRSRGLDEFVDGIQVRQIINYKAAEFVGDKEILCLPYLYKKFDNQAEILCFAGETDDMTSLEQKKAFLNQVEHSRVETITKYRIDRVIFNSTDHGVGADFIELFNLAYKSYFKPKEEAKKKSKEKHHISFEDVRYETELFWYEIKWEDGIPFLYRFPKD